MREADEWCKWKNTTVLLYSTDGAAGNFPVTYTHIPLIMKETDRVVNIYIIQKYFITDSGLQFSIVNLPQYESRLAPPGVREDGECCVIK